MSYQTKSAARRTRTVTAQGQINGLNSILALLPSDSKESDEALKASLKQHGQLAPILRRRGRVIDGHRRLRLLKNLSISPWFVDIDLKPTASQSKNKDADTELLGRSFLEVNGCRRELNDAVKAAMANTLANLKKGDNQHSPEGVSQKEAAMRLGISTDTMQRVKTIEKADKKVFSKMLRGEVSIPQAQRMIDAKAVVRKVKTALDQDADIELSIDQVIAKDVRFNFIYADPAWSYNSAIGGLPTYSGDPRKHYTVMNLEAIKAMQVEKIAAKDAVLWLWTPNCLLKDALEVMESWGFKYVTSAVWVKKRAPQTWGAVEPLHETLLVGHRGQGLQFKGKCISSVWHEPATKHSRKPTWFAKQAEHLYPEAAKLELFCRTPRKGWHCFGNQMGQVAAPNSQAANNDAVAVPNTRARKARATRVTTRRSIGKKTRKASRRVRHRKAA